MRRHEVYRARDPRLGRDVALKVITKGFSHDPDLKRFEQEARAAGALAHPNVVAIHDMGIHDGSPFVVMEPLEGETLRERLSQGVLLVRRAIDYAVQAAHGLAAAHAKGIVHRDLSPGRRKPVARSRPEGRRASHPMGPAQAQPLHGRG